MAREIDVGREVELKFQVAAEDLEAVLGAAPTGQDEVRQLHSIYFDTETAVLAAQQMSLRIREEGGRKIQTLKHGSGVSREEREAEVADLDTSWPELTGLALVVVSEVRVLRRQRLVSFAGAEIEIAADIGEVSAGGRKEAFSELELELKSGPEAALHKLAAILGRAAGLTPSSVSKADRGRALRSI